MATLRNIAISLLHMAGITEINRTLQRITRDRTRALLFLGLQVQKTVRDDLRIVSERTGPGCERAESCSPVDRSCPLPQSRDRDRGSQ